MQASWYDSALQWWGNNPGKALAGCGLVVAGCGVALASVAVYAGKKIKELRKQVDKNQLDQDSAFFNMYHAAEIAKQDEQAKNAELQRKYDILLQNNGLALEEQKSAYDQQTRNLAGHLASKLAERNQHIRKRLEDAGSLGVQLFSMHSARQQATIAGLEQQITILQQTLENENNPTLQKQLDTLQQTYQIQQRIVNSYVSYKKNASTQTETPATQFDALLASAPISPTDGDSKSRLLLYQETSPAAHGSASSSQLLGMMLNDLSQKKEKN